MRWIDHWVGLPLCFVLAILVWVVRRILPKRRREISGNGTLVVLKFFGLGSIMQATPLLRAIRQQYPSARLAFVTFQANAGLLRRLRVCDELRIIRTDAPRHFVLDTLRQIIWLRRHRVEAVLDLEFFSKFSTLMAFLSGAHIRVGFHLNDFWRYTLVTHPVYFNYYRHITDVYQQMAARIGVTITDTQLSRIDPGEAARQSAERFLREHGWSPGIPLLGVNVNAGDMSLERRWPLERFAVLIHALLDRRPDLRVLLTGSPDEKEYVESIRVHIPPAVHDRIIVSAGSWSLDEFVAALPLLSAYVTNDSGPMHLAASEGVPVVSLWGPGRPDFYAPRTPAHRAVYADYPCSPCLYMFTAFEGMWCDHEAWCMQAIQPGVVVEAVEGVLAAATQLSAMPRSPGG